MSPLSGKVQLTNGYELGLGIIFEFIQQLPHQQTSN